MCHSSSPDTATCNRTPFLSEDGCDRGSVDIRQFDDLPYCGDINPTSPEIPPEIVDSPVALNIPPPCACMNIDYVFGSMGYNKESRTFAASASFRSVGDCCEGLYETNLNLRVPCPVVGQSPSKMRMSIGYGSGPGSTSASYILPDSSNCTIVPQNVDMNLNIPCPVSTQTQQIYCAKISDDVEFYQNGNRIPKDQVTYFFSKGKPGSWSISYGNSKISWDYYNGKWRSTLYSAGLTATKGGVPIGDLQGKDGLIQVNCTPETDVSYPASELENQDDGLLHMSISYGDGRGSASASFIAMDAAQCTIRQGTPRLHLNIPCPVMGAGDSNKIKMKIGYGVGPQEAEVVYIKKDRSGCTIEPQDPTIDLRLPCPFGEGGEKKLTFNPVRFVGGRLGPTQAGFMDVDAGTCRITPKNAAIQLVAPCPTGPGELSVTAAGLATVNDSWDGVRCHRHIHIDVASPQVPPVKCKDVVLGLKWESPNLKVVMGNTCTDNTREVVVFTAKQHTGGC